jgi:hypothetical protein
MVQPVDFLGRWDKLTSPTDLEASHFKPETGTPATGKGRDYVIAVPGGSGDLFHAGNLV